MKEFVTCALTGISVPTDCSSEYCMKCLMCAPAKEWAKNHATMPQLLKAADARSAAQDAINNREDPEKTNNFEKEINTMDEKYINEDYIIGDKITSKIMNHVCSIAINFDTKPVDLGFKLNNLNDSEFRLYAKKLMRHVLDNSVPLYEYPSQQDHDKAFYDFRDKNKHLIDDTKTVKAPAPESEYHIPTQFEINAKYNCEWKDLEIAMLKQRIAAATDAYRFMEAIIQDYESKQPKRRKTSVKK